MAGSDLPAGVQVCGRTDLAAGPVKTGGPGCRCPGGVPRPRGLRASQGRTTQASWVWLTGPSELFPAFMTPWGEALVTHVSGVAHLTLVRSNDSRLEGQPCPRPPAGRSEKCCLDRFHPPEPTDPVGGMRLCAYLLMTWAKEVAGDLQGACRGHQSRLPGEGEGGGTRGPVWQALAGGLKGEDSVCLSLWAVGGQAARTRCIPAEFVSGARRER